MSRFDPRALLQAFSTLTLDLHRLAQDQDIDNFHRHALERISQLLPFDSAWWGRAAVIDGLPEEHSTYLYNCRPPIWRIGSRCAMWTLRSRSLKKGPARP